MLDTTKLAKGTKVFYTGDMSNESSVGIIILVHPADRWYAVAYDIKFDDGHTSRKVLPSSFSAGPGQRMWVLSEHTAMRRAKFVKMLEGLDLSTADNDRALADFDKNNK